MGDCEGDEMIIKVWAKVRHFDYEVAEVRDWPRSFADFIAETQRLGGVVHNDSRFIPLSQITYIEVVWC